MTSATAVTVRRGCGALLRRAAGRKGRGRCGRAQWAPGEADKAGKPAGETKPGACIIFERGERNSDRRARTRAWVEGGLVRMQVG